MLINEVIGPHIGKELELMIQGTKPAAIISSEDLARWSTAIKKYGWTVLDAGEDSIVVSRSRAHAQELFRLIVLPPSDRTAYFTKMGQLLGYSADDIAHFLHRIQNPIWLSKLSMRVGANNFVGKFIDYELGPLAARLSKIGAGALKAATGVGAGLATYSGGLNAGEAEELARIRANQTVPTK